MATLSIYLGEDQLLPDDLGIGFFGNDGFGAPVIIGEYNGRTFVTNTSGTSENFECNNTKFLHASGTILGQTGSGILLTELPNHLATFNVRFGHPQSVRAASPKLYIYDGTETDDEPNKENDPSGLTCYCAEIRHTGVIQDDTGLGDIQWMNIHGSTFLSMVESPGTSGIRPYGIYTYDTRHDWYVAMTVTPTLHGNKQFGMYFELEFV